MSSKHYAASVRAVRFGSGEKAVTIGGNSALPFYSFDAPTVNPPKIGMVLPVGGSDDTLPKLQSFYTGCESAADAAKRAASLPGVSFLCLDLQCADPNGENRSVEDCTALVRSVCEATDLPLAVIGCKSIEKDTALFAALAKASEGKAPLFLSAKEENYRELCAVLSKEQKLCAESSVDINLAKQLNVLMLQNGTPAENLIMHAGSAAAGYGFEYLASTMERIRLASLAQNDDSLQMPILTPVFSDVWGVKEVTLPEAEKPEWGDAEERGIEMEITTAAACLASGSDAVILRHPDSVAAIHEMIAAL